MTTTPAKSPLLQQQELQPSTHITAVGSDTPEKQKLDSKIIGNADLVVADSIEQCKARGEIAQAMRQGQFYVENALELGDVISGGRSGRINDQQITVADLTGVAVQDIQIASAIFDCYLANKIHPWAI